MSELDAIRIRDDVLQAMYWMYSEGLGETPTGAELARFLALEPEILRPYLDRFVADGYLQRAGGGYCLTPTGTELGKRTFAAEFAGLTGQAHGECGDPDCWCHDSPEEATRCLEDRLDQHAH